MSKVLATAFLVVFGAAFISMAVFPSADGVPPEAQRGLYLMLGITMLISVLIWRRTDA